MNLKIAYGASLHSAAAVELGLWKARLGNRSWTFSKSGQLLAVLAGITTLVYGTYFGVSHVLPTLVSGRLTTGAVALPMALGTTVLCLLALTNAIGKPEISADPSEWPELDEGSWDSSPS